MANARIPMARETRVLFGTHCSDRYSSPVYSLINFTLDTAFMFMASLSYSGQRYKSPNGFFCISRKVYTNFATRSRVILRILCVPFLNVTMVL